jgi:hypothetical protein
MDFILCGTLIFHAGRVVFQPEWKIFLPEERIFNQEKCASTIAKKGNNQPIKPNLRFKGDFVFALGCLMTS